MHAYLIVGGNKDQRQREIDHLIKSHKSHKIVIDFAKIEDVKKLNRYLKFTVNKPTAIILNEVDKASLEAQNAFLKNLEEPQKKILFILLAKSLYPLPSTIKSRCQVIWLSDNLNLDKDEEKKLKKFIEGDMGKKMMFIKDINSREKAIKFMKSILIIYQKKVQETKGEKKHLAKEIENAIKTLDALNSNGNIQLQLTNFIVNLDEEKPSKIKK